MLRRVGTGSVALVLLLAVAPAAARPLALDGRALLTPVASSVPAATATRTKPVVVIDPGHSGRRIASRTTHGLRDVDYPNYPEIYETWDVSACVATALRADGYRVVLTKRHATSSVSLTERARIADRNHAALAVSVHDDHSQGASFEAVYSQRGVRRHGHWPAMYRGSGSTRTVYRHPSVARRSAGYAATIATARTRAQHRTVRIAQNNFDGRPGLEPGNLALVQLLSRTPWVYNEAGVHGRVMSVAAETSYALGLVSGIERAVPTPAADGVARSTLHGCLQRRLADRPARYRP